jgi:hypothetical protein
MEPLASCVFQGWNDCCVSAGILIVSARVARFFLVNHTKTWKIYQMTTNVTKYTFPRHSKIYLNWDFWYEKIQKIPSGNPGVGNLAVPKQLSNFMFQMSVKSTATRWVWEKIARNPNPCFCQNYKSNSYITLPRK